MSEEIALALGQGEGVGLLRRACVPKPVFPAQGQGAHSGWEGVLTVGGRDGQSGRAGALLRFHRATSADPTASQAEAIKSTMRFMLGGNAPCEPNQATKRSRVDSLEF